MKWPYLGVTNAFCDVLKHRRIVLSRDECRDLVSAALSSQLLFMAGPSGTGKSAVAEALAALFTHADRRRRIQVPLGVATESELLGYPTTIGGVLRYQPSAWLDVFQGLGPAGTAAGGAAPLVLGAQQTTPGPPSSAEICPPVMIFEEANLGTMEGYLSSFMRDFSGLSSEKVVLTLHGSNASVERTGGGTAVPKSMEVGLWPRVIATLNVDQTAEPPSRKVAARGLAIVLEPPELTLDDLRHSVLGGGEPAPPGYEYFQALGRPTDAIQALNVHDTALFDSVVSDVHAAAIAVAAVLKLPPIISPRNLLRMVAFTSTYLLVGLGEGEGTESAELLRKLGLEYAVLHIVLPSLSEENFHRVREAIGTSAGMQFAPLASASATMERSPLHRRLQTVSAGRAATDFWSALS
ncbi:MAG: hypothetical protein KC766_19925 [Myxococcales bacterium]|nr:hypothetical protein [Myxococcales bacterium]